MAPRSLNEGVTKRNIPHFNFRGVAPGTILAKSDEHVSGKVRNFQNVSELRHFRGSHKDTAEMWAKLPEAVQIKVGSAGFYFFATGLCDMKRTPILVRLLRERWWDTTHTFHFSFGELTITPADFTAITGLACEGTALAVDFTRTWSGEELEELVGFRPVHSNNWADITVVAQGVDHAIALVDAEDPDSIERCARAFIWYMLSNTIFANGGSGVCLHLLGALRNFSRIGYIDWGSAGLAALYHGLDRVCRDAVSFDGFAMVVEIWAYEVLGLRPFDLKDSTWRFPVFAMYNKNNRQKARAVDTLTMGGGRTRLDDLALDAVIPFPWSEIQGFLGVSMERTRQRYLMRALVTDGYYLGERVRWQWFAGALRAIPVDIPHFMWDVTSLGNRAMEMAGHPGDALLADGDYEVFVAERLMGPLRVGARLGPVHQVVDIDAPPRSLTYTDEAGAEITVAMPRGEVPDRYRLPPGATAVGRASFEEWQEQACGWKTAYLALKQAIFGESSSRKRARSRSRSQSPPDAAT